MRNDGTAAAGSAIAEMAPMAALTAKGAGEMDLEALLSPLSSTTPADCKQALTTAARLQLSAIGAQGVFTDNVLGGGE